MVNRKPVIFYTQATRIEVGLQAWLIRVSEDILITTSTIIKVLEDGAFETKNTIYKPNIILG